MGTEQTEDTDELRERTDLLICVYEQLPRKTKLKRTRDLGREKQLPSAPTNSIVILRDTFSRRMLSGTDEIILINAQRIAGIVKLLDRP